MTNDRPRPRHPDLRRAPAYESYTVGGLVAAMAIVPLFVAVLAAPALVVAATLGAATVPLFERGVRVYAWATDEKRETTVGSATS